MSASSKKKLRKEQNAAALTEKQLNEQKEAKTLKRYTLTFVVAMILVVVFAIGAVVRLPIIGAIDRGSHAANIGSHQLSATDLSYYYKDAINDHYNAAYETYGSYAQYFLGFTAGKPLNEQKHSSEDYETWADYFMETGLKNAAGIYALYDEAMAKGHKLTDDEQKALDSNIEAVETMAKLYGYSSANAYLRANYGDGANIKTYTEYFTVNAIASSYFNAHADSIEYTDADYRDYEKGKFNDFSSFTYYTYTIAVSDYLEGGTKGSDGKVTYSDAEKKAAEEAAKADADKLAADTYKDFEAFEKAVKALKVNKDKKDIKVNEYDDVLYSGISNSDVKKWIGNTARKSGEATSITVTTKENDADKNTTLKTSGYVVTVFQERNDNKINLVDVQHILIKFQGGTKDKDTGETVYTVKEKAEAKEKAEKQLEEWKNGDATKESFAELAKEKSEDTGSKANGGLYEDIYPGQMVTNFNDWCFDESRKSGDTGLVETEYGYHIMYFVETNDITYRDYMIKNAKLSEDMNAWHEELTEKVTIEKVDLSRMDWDYKFG